MTKLLELLAEAGAYSVEDLADALDATPQDVKRQMEFRANRVSAPRLRLHLRLQGLLRPCGGLAGNMPVMWEVVGT